MKTLYQRVALNNLITTIIAAAMPMLCSAAPVNYGTAIKTTASSAAINTNGFVYGATRNGNDNNQFYRYNIKTKKVDIVKQVTGTSGTWAILDNGNDIYFGTYRKASLYKYTKTTQNLIKLADFDSEQYVWDMVKDHQGNIWLGTSPNALLYRLNMNTQALSNFGSVFKGKSSIDYARAIEEYNGIIYIGTGVTTAGLYAFNPETGKKTNILPVAYRSEETVYDLALVEGVLLATLLPSQKILKIDLLSGKVSEIPGNFYADTTVSSKPSGHDVFSGMGDIVLEYNILDDTIARITPTGYGGLGGAKIYGNTLSGINIHSEFVEINLLTNKKTAVDLTAVGLPKTPAIPVAMMVDNGVAYFSERQLRRFDTRTRTEQYANINGEPKTLCALNGLIYAAHYTKAMLYSYDAANITKGKLIWLIGNNQNRPLDMSCDNTIVAIATEPNYGKFGGALSVYNTLTRTKYVWLNIVANHTIRSVDLHGNHAYIGTSIFGGTGAPLRSGFGKFVKLDIKTKKVLWSTLASSKLIKDVVFDGENRVFGLGDNGVLYKLNSENGQIEKQASTNLAGLAITKTGKIYGVSSSSIFSIDSNLTMLKLTNLPKITNFTSDKITGKSYVVSDKNLIEFALE